ncbi:hypothetical protein [Bradyrhizobium sp. 2S1]|uniref:hypothetical protein n=1 Tax=Bradyrhizobium sp. 2S1 TaxID=1404429 RepID=UPI001408E818|nr:hypothetical protein [Bradyrhizobium sp. 2S1]MCK7664547.1 hypothetical protein [Bradyrhizobium sp. 2S1]
MATLSIDKGQVSTTGEDETQIHHSELAELVTKHPDEVAKTLSSEVSPINASDLSVDAAGRVCVKDAEFTKCMSKKMETVVADNGIICPTNAVFC